jgi:hypothetical protein
MYSGQWLAVIGFLPSIYVPERHRGCHRRRADRPPSRPSTWPATSARVDCCRRGVGAVRLLTIGFATMALAATATFAGSGDAGLAPALRYAAVLLFSSVGG